jgi:hypothetical protein
MKLFKKLKRKHYDLRSELANWVERNIGSEYVDDALEKYDKINSGVPIGSMVETIAFIDMVNTIKAEAEGQ